MKTWLYILVALASVALAIVFARNVKDKPTKARIGAWISIIVGAGFVLLYAFKLDRDVFVLVLGISCIITGAVAISRTRIVK